MIRRIPEYAPRSVFLLTVAAGLLSVTLLFGLGEAAVTPFALVASFVLLIAGGFGLAPAHRRSTDQLVRRSLWLIVIAQMLLILVVPPTFFQETADALTFRIIAGLAVVTAATFIPVHSRGLRDPRVWVLVACYLAAGIWVITVSPNPLIDVHLVQQMGIELFLAGENPYSIRTYPDLYGPDSPFYGPGMVEGGFLTFGYPYPPLSFWLAFPGFVLFGDHRFSLLCAMATGSLLITGIRNGDRSTAAALLVLFTPGTYLLIEQAWIEPYAICLLAAVVFLISRSQTSASVALGLLMVAKQTLVPVVAMGALLLARSRRQSGRVVVIATLSGIAVTLPLVAWNVQDFVDSAVTLQLRQPFRPNSMTISAWLSDGRNPALPVWTAFVAMGAVMLAASIRLPRTATGFAIAVAASYFAFFMTSKYAFANYYSFVLAAVCCAIAASRVPSEVGADAFDLPRVGPPSTACRDIP